MDNQLHPRAQLTLIGHQKSLDHLCKSFTSNTFPPAWLLVGEKGIGKATLAYNFARWVLASSHNNQAMIERQTALGVYPNLLTIEKEADSDGKVKREIPVDAARKTLAALRQSAAIPGWRVVVIDAIDEMNRNAANALLKVLEEPPTQTLMLLICHSLGNVLPTIRSRCCQLSCSPLSDHEIMKVLQGTEEEKHLLVKLARGSLGRALSLQEIGAYKLMHELLNLFSRVFKGDFRSIQSFADILSKDDSRFPWALDLFQEWIYRIILYSHKREDFSNNAKAFDQLLQIRPASHWVEAWHRLHTFQNLAKTSSLDKKQTLMAAFFILENPQSGECFSRV